jgi:hypothetical protein
MSKYFADYWALLGSKQQLDYCKQADSLGDLLARIKQLWNCTQLNDHELLGEINRLNQIPVDDSVMLAGNWLPYRYQPKRQLVNWLIPDGHATEPFQDEYISRCCQRLVNQIIQPRSSLESALQQANKIADVQPAGFIFHLSRCGSTLVSGCFSELDSTCVFSESPLLTEVLLDDQLAQHEQQISLRAFINLQAAAFPLRPQIIIKWNAWDIFHWELIRGLYPQVPVIFLVRDPVEILASHQKSAGRHMAGDKSLATADPVFVPTGRGDLVQFRGQVLGALLRCMCAIRQRDVIYCLDYKSINEKSLMELLGYLAISFTREEQQLIVHRLAFHSKTPGVPFVSDTSIKQSSFAEADKTRIQQWLQPLYRQVLEVTK